MLLWEVIGSIPIACIFIFIFFRKMPQLPDFPHVKSSRAVFTETYIKSCFQDSIKVIKNSLITTASREYLEGIIKNVLPKYYSHTHYFPICKVQEDFSSFLFSLRNKAYDTIEKFRTFKRPEFTEKALVVFNEVAKDY